MVADISVWIDENHPPNDSSPNTWIEMTGEQCPLAGMVCFRGRRHELEPATVGSLQYTFRNRNRDYDPTYGNGRIAFGWEPTRTQVQVRATVGITTYTVWTGHMDDWPGTDDITNDVTVTASDGLKYLSEQRLPNSDWDYEIQRSDAAHWYQMNERHGTSFTDRIGDNDGVYQVIDDGTNIDSGTHKQYRTDSIIKFDQDGPETAYDQGAHNKQLGEDKLSRMIIPAGDNLSTQEWTVGIWVQSYETPRDETGAISEDWAPTTKHQPVWVQDPDANLWNGEKTGLMITSAGDFQALYQGSAGGTEFLTVFGTGKKGWNGEPHLVWVGKGSAFGPNDFWIEVDNFPRQQISGLPSTATNDAKIVIGGEFSDTTRVVAATPVYPWFRGVYQDMVIFDRFVAADETGDLYQAAVNGLYGRGTDSHDIDIVVAKILQIADYNIGTPVLPTATFNMAADQYGRRTALEYLQMCERTELGRMFIGKDGSFTMVRENQLKTGGIKATFSNGNTPGEIMWDRIDIGYSRVASVYNDVTCEWWADEQRRRNISSINQYGPRTLTWNTALRNAAPARTRAQLLVDRYSDPVVRINSVTILVTNDTDADTLLGLELGDAVRIKRLHPQPLPSADYQGDHIVEGIEHRFGEGTEWRVTLYLSPDFY